MAGLSGQAGKPEGGRRSPAATEGLWVRDGCLPVFRTMLDDGGAQQTEFDFAD